MQAVDKFGRPIYPHIYRQLEAIGRKLVRYGYQESESKPNLFVCRYQLVTFYADMRGTEIIPIWQDPTPLFYWFWAKPVPGEVVRQRAVYIEWNRLSDVDLRLSNDLSCDALVDSQMIGGS